MFAGVLWATVCGRLEIVKDNVAQETGRRSRCDNFESRDRAIPSNRSVALSLLGREHAYFLVPCLRLKSSGARISIMPAIFSAGGPPARSSFLEAPKRTSHCRGGQIQFVACICDAQNGLRWSSRLHSQGDPAAFPSAWMRFSSEQLKANNDFAVLRGLIGGFYTPVRKLQQPPIAGQSN